MCIRIGILLQIGGIFHVIRIDGTLLSLQFSAPAQRLAGRKVDAGQVLTAAGQLLHCANDDLGSRPALEIATAVRTFHGVRYIWIVGYICMYVYPLCGYLVSAMSFLWSRLLGLQASCCSTRRDLDSSSAFGHIW